MLNYLLKPCRFDPLDRFLRKDGVKILDIGIANHSPSVTKKYYPRSVYHGLDLSLGYGAGSDFEALDKFYMADLNQPDALNQIPNETYDFIFFNHVIEHLTQGEDALEQIVKKLKKGGYLYLETPSAKSRSLPRMKGPLLGGSLNFYDDPTHVKVYEEAALRKVLEDNGMKILKIGLRHSLKRIIFFPVYFVGSFFYLKRLDGCVFWDILGFVELVIAQKEC